MQGFLSFLNGNPGLVAILGVIVGWVLSSITSLILYRRQRKDEAERDMMERFKHKGEFIAYSNLEANGASVFNMEVIVCPYGTKLGSHGEVDVFYSKNTSKDNIIEKTIILENIGESDINEMEIVTEDPKNCAVIKREYFDRFVEDGAITYSVPLGRKIRKGETVALTIRCLMDDSRINLDNAPLAVFYRDSLHNVCEQELFVGNININEPRLINYADWRDQANVKKNLAHWKDRLKHKTGA